MVTDPGATQFCTEGSVLDSERETDPSSREVAVVAVMGVRCRDVTGGIVRSWE